MSAGYIQLVALGQQDAYLSGEPQVTYFSGVYKRHTPFVLEAYDIPFNDQYINFGGTSICHIPPKGDLIRGLTLKMSLPALYNPGNDWTWNTPASSSNFPTVWYGFSNGAIQQVTSKLGSFYYSTNAYNTTWASTFLPQLNYNSNTNQFVFSNVSNVIIQSGFTQTMLKTNAQYPVFWGFDPVNYSLAANGNLIYNATVSPLSNLTANSISNLLPNTFISTLVPDFTLQQAGWIQTTGVPVNSQTGFYATLAQPLGLTNSNQFLNLTAQSPGTNSPYWSINDLLTTTFFVSAGGLVQFLGVGYYNVRIGFNVSAGGVISISYGKTTSPTLPASPTFLYTYNYTVSPDPTSPAIIPILADGASYYYFYVQTNLPCNALLGTYIAATPANDTYQFSSNITLTSGTKVPLYGNTQPLNSSVVLTPTSNVNFPVNGEYLVSGVLSVANAIISNTTEVYATSVTFGNTASSYTYDLSQQGRNPTYAFSIPIVANKTSNYWASVSTQSTSSNLLANSFFTIQQVGVLSDTTPGIVLPYNGILLQSTSSTLTAPLNLKTNFSSNTNSSIISVNASGNLVFNNVASYMLTGVFYTSSPVTNVLITSSDSLFSQNFNFSLGLSPPYTISVPFRITNNSTSISYGITVNTFQSGATVQSGTYLTVAPIASNTLIGGFQTYNYYDSVGTIAIVNADLKVGGQTIQSLKGEYIEVWNELNVPYENQPGLQLLTGKYDTQTSVGPPGRTYYVNLPYYFYGNPELSLPIVALGRQDVEVWVTFNNFSNLTSVSVTNPSLTATIITEYAYLSNPEIDWFQNHKLDYVITQCQYDAFQLQSGFQNSIFELVFKHPIKELFFLIHPTANLPYNYTTPGGGTDAVTFGMTFNGEDAFLTSTINTLYVGAIEPFVTHVNFFSQPNTLTSQQPNQYGRQFYMYSFSTNPFGTLSSGQINFSRIRHVLLETNITNTALNYPSKIFNVIALNQNILRIENGIAGIMFH